MSQNFIYLTFGLRTSFRKPFHVKLTLRYDVSPTGHQKPVRNRHLHQKQFTAFRTDGDYSYCVITL